METQTNLHIAQRWIILIDLDFVIVRGKYFGCFVPDCDRMANYLRVPCCDNRCILWLRRN